MSYAEAVLAAWDGLRLPSELLIIEVGVAGTYRPIQVVMGQGLPPVLPVICHPHWALEILGHPED